MNIKEDMEKKIIRFFDLREKRKNHPLFQVHRLVVAAGDMDPLTWLSAQNSEVQLFWSGRDDGFELAGVGIADRITGHFNIHPNDIVKRCRELLPENPGLRYFGGFAFQEEEAVDEAWKAFGASVFMAFRFELVRTGGQSSFVCNLIFRKKSPLSRNEILSVLNTLVFPGGEIIHPAPEIISRRDVPEHKDWKNQVENVLELLRQEVVEKIVLARKVSLTGRTPIQGPGLLWRLRKVTPNGYHFCIQLQKGRAFIGASPERLMQRKDRWVWSEAVAGTRPRGNSSEQDDELAQQLLTSIKDRREHDVVRKSVLQSLHLLCDSLQVDASPRLLRLATKQHLFSASKGRLRTGISDGDLISHLHPTPATGGYPTKNALSEIKRIEGFCRGWYAGPVGWISRDAAEFAVAIRSALVDGSHLHLYSGAGIVEGSHPEEEWEEIENKICDFLHVTDHST